MLRCIVKIDDKDMFKEIAGKKAVVQVGWFEGQNYEAVDEPFYANVPKPKEMEIGYKFTGKEKPGKYKEKYIEAQNRNTAIMAALHDRGLVDDDTLMDLFGYDQKKTFQNAISRARQRI